MLHGYVELLSQAGDALSGDAGLAVLDGDHRGHTDHLEAVRDLTQG